MYTFKDNLKIGNKRLSSPYNLDLVHKKLLFQLDFLHSLATLLCAYTVKVPLQIHFTLLTVHLFQAQILSTEHESFKC